MPNEMTPEQFGEYLAKTIPSLQENLAKTIKLCCKKVQDDIQYSMSHTQRNMSKSYYTNNSSVPHHPSLPGNPPAVDTGNLRQSIRYEVINEGEGKSVYGIVGSTQSDPNYAVWMEYGTSDGKIAKRPWLRPAMIKNNDWIRKSIANSVADGLKLKGVE